MKTLACLVLGALVLLALPACNTTEKYAKNNAAAAQWLTANAGTARIDVSGRWHAESWGGALFTQTGNRITGTVGDYTAKGVVKGNLVFLTLSEDGWVYYTVMMRETPTGSLKGYYSGEVPYSPADERSIEIVRSNL